MPTNTSIWKCPHCGKPSKMFEQTTEVLDEPFEQQNPSIFSEAIMFVTRFGLIVSGTMFTIWIIGWPAYWLAPVVGLAWAVGPSVVTMVKKDILTPPPIDQNPKKRVKLSIDVTERRGPLNRRTLIDVFSGCRPRQLSRVANAHLNDGVPLTRRQMAKVGVSEGQFTRIRDVLVVNYWADLDGDHDTATAVPNWQGRAILRGILAKFPNPP